MSWPLDGDWDNNVNFDGDLASVLASLCTAAAQRYDVIGLTQPTWTATGNSQPTAADFEGMDIASTLYVTLGELQAAVETLFDEHWAIYNSGNLLRIQLSEDYLWTRADIFTEAGFGSDWCDVEEIPARGFAEFKFFGQLKGVLDCMKYYVLKSTEPKRVWSRRKGQVHKTAPPNGLDICIYGYSTKAAAEGVLIGQWEPLPDTGLATVSLATASCAGFYGTGYNGIITFVGDIQPVCLGTWNGYTTINGSFAYFTDWLHGMSHGSALPGDFSEFVAKVEAENYAPAEISMSWTLLGNTFMHGGYTDSPIYVGTTSEPTEIKLDWTYPPTIGSGAQALSYTRTTIEILFTDLSAYLTDQL